MAGTIWERAATSVGFRPIGRDQIVAPRSWLERVGVPGPDSSPAEVVVGLVFLAVLVLLWVSIVLSDMNVALRILCVAAIVVDLAMIVARLRLLLERAR